MLADHGDVFIGADATAQDGILTVNVAEGNIKSNHFDGGENPGGSDVKLTSVNGSVDIYTGKGDVDLHEVYAKDKASCRYRKRPFKVVQDRRQYRCPDHQRYG